MNKDLKPGDKVVHYEYGNQMISEYPRDDGWVRLSNGKFVDAAFLKPFEYDGKPCSGDYDDLPDRKDCIRAGHHVCGRT